MTELDQATCPEFCPKCQAGYSYGADAPRVFDKFWCGTVIEAGELNQSDECVRRQMQNEIRSLAAENARLTAALAAAEKRAERASEAFMRYAGGDIVIRWNPDGFWGYGRGVRGTGPHATALEAALAIPALETEPAQPDEG